MKSIALFMKKKTLNEVFEILKQDIQHSQELRLSDLNSLGFSTKVKEWIAKLFVHFL